MERGHKLEIGASSMVGWCIANEEARIALDVGQDPVRFDAPELPATRSELALPLISRGEVLGGLTIQSAEEAAFADDDIAVLQAMTDQLANAIKGARLYERAQREIAERKQAEEALRESEARYRDIAASIPGALYQFRMAPDGDLGITYMSEGAEAVLAQPLEKLKDPSFLFSTVHPDDLASLRASIDDSARQVAPWQHEFRVVKPNGQVAWVHGSSSPRRLADGSILWNGVLLDISERKRAEQALRESEERYRAVSELMSDFAYAVSLDPDATYTLDWATKPFDAFTSYSRDEMETQGGWLNLIHPDDREEARRYFHTLLRTGQPDAIEFRIVTRGGEERWVYNRSHPVWDQAEERVVRIIGAAQDITERKRAEKALQEYARKHAGLYTVTAAAASSLLPDEMLPTVLEETIAVAGADAGWVVLPGEPPCVAASQGVPDSLANAETCQGSDYLSRLPALELADRPAELGTITEAPHPVAEAHKGFDDVVCVPLTAYGQMMGFLHLARQDPDAAAELDEGLLSTIGRQLGIALRNAQLYQQARQVDRLQAVNEITTAVVSSLEMDEVLCQILEKTCRALGAAEGSVLLRDADTGELVFAMTLEGDGNDLQGMHLEPGQGVAGWVAEHDRAVYVNDVEQDARFCEAIDAVTGFETHSLLCAPMGHRGEMLGVLEFVNKQDGAFDNEDLKLLEAVASIAAVALKNARFYGDLKQLLREREETQAQMIHTEKMSALGRLMASIAHEINNPLQAVDGYLSLAEEKLDDPGRVDALRRYLRIAGEEVDRISDIVSRTRDFYRPEREGFWDVDVETLIENVLLLTRKKLEHSDVTVEHTGPEELPTVEANADQLKQVFLNLVINAVEAMPEGGTLYIRTALEREADVVRIEFEDTGVGMSQEMMDQVFEPFVTTKEEGTGLGMSISYGIVQAHNGAIAVSSEKGAGTTFTIRLPLEQPEP
jgi:PAS domain S-box-containing protein